MTNWGMLILQCPVYFYLMLHWIELIMSWIPFPFSSLSLFLFLEVPFFSSPLYLVMHCIVWKWISLLIAHDHEMYNPYNFLVLLHLAGWFCYGYTFKASEKAGNRLFLFHHWWCCRIVFPFSVYSVWHCFICNQPLKKDMWRHVIDSLHSTYGLCRDIMWSTLN